MITSLRIVDFKNFADDTLLVGPFTLIVGTNASGKSNIRDAFRFLHGIGRGYTLAEIIGGKYGAGGQIEWEPIRGAANEIIRFDQAAFGLNVKLTLGSEDATYLIRVAPEIRRTGGFRVLYECLRIDQKIIYEKPESIYEEVYVVLPDSHQIDIKRDRPALTQIHESKQVANIFKEYTTGVIDALHSMRFLDLAADRMRQRSFSGQTVLGNCGENLATVLREICTNKERKETLIEWIHELTPMDVKDFEFPVSLDGWVQLVICEKNNRKVSAYSASDGTLRFSRCAGRAVRHRSGGPLLLPKKSTTASTRARLQLLIDLIERQTAKGQIQVVTTTHSSDLLTLVNDKTFENISVVCRMENSQDAIIRTVSELPAAAKFRKSQGLGRLLADGWMEDALTFTTGGGQSDESAE